MNRRLSLLALFAVLSTAAVCQPKTPTPPATLTRHIPIAVVDAGGEAVNGCQISINGFPAKPMTSIDVLATVGALTIAATCPSGTVAQALQPIPDAIQLTIAAPANVDPGSLTTAQLTYFQGDFGGVRVDGLAPVCPPPSQDGIWCVGDNGGTPRGLLGGVAFTYEFEIYSPAQQDAIIAATKARRYTHLLIGVICGSGRDYHSLYPPLPCSGDTTNAALHRIYNAGLIPVCETATNGAGDKEIVQNLPPGMDRSLCRVVFGSFETPWADCQLRLAHGSFPNALVYWEPNFDLENATPVADSCSPTPMPQGNLWIRYAQQAYNLTGIFLETNASLDVGDAEAKIDAILQPWRDVQLVLMETTAYPSFWNNTSEADTVAFNDALLQHYPQIHGFLNGGTPHAPPAGDAGGGTTINASGDMIDVSQAHFFNNPSDVVSWPATASITKLDLRPDGVHVEFTKRDGPGRWPDVPFGDGGSLEYTLGMCLKISGTWDCSAAIQFWNGLDASGGPPTGAQIAINWFYDPNRWGPMAGYEPADGETVGYFVCAGNCRGSDGGQSTVHERSNIVTVPLPGAAGASFTFKASASVLRRLKR